MTVGTGYAPCHHGEILQGTFRDREGRRTAGLVTLPLAGPGTRAEFVPHPGAPPAALTVTPAGRPKALRAARLAVAECARRRHRRPCGGRLRLSSEIPVGLGMGSSSSDVIATVRAVAAAFAVRLPPAAVARVAVRAEGASDPLMHSAGAPVLFAQREGRVLEVLGGSLPPAVVVGCVIGGGRPVDTLKLPALVHDDADLAFWERLRALLRRAVATSDTALLGHVATSSARRHQRSLPHEEFPLLTRIARRLGACGVQVAHSGCVAGLILDPACAGHQRRLRQCVAALESSGIPVTRTFATTSGTSTTSGNPTAPATSTALPAPTPDKEAPAWTST